MKTQVSMKKWFIFIFTFILLTCSVQGISYGQTLTASTPEALTETNLNNSVVTLLLEGAAWADISKIRYAVAVSGIDGVTIKTERYKSGRRWVCTSGCGSPVEFGYWTNTYSSRPRVRRMSDTVLEVPLTNNSDFDTDATLTLTVKAAAIANYDGPALTAEVPVTSYKGVIVSVTSPLTEATLDKSVVTLTLDGVIYESDVSKIRDAVTVSGITGVTVDTTKVQRLGDRKVTVELNFDGTDFDTNATLTFNVTAGAIANYTGDTFTAEIPVTAIKESVEASVAAPLTESTLNESRITLILTGVAYESDVSKIRDAVTVSGINGVSANSSKIQRLSDSKVTVELGFDGTDFDTNATLTFSVAAGAIANYTGDAFTTEISVTAYKESLSVVSRLTEATLNTDPVTLTLTGATYEQDLSKISNAVTVSGITGVKINTAKVKRLSNRRITVALDFDGTNLDKTATLTFSVAASAITNYTGAALTAEVSVTPVKESVSASVVSPLTEATLNGSVVTLSLSDATYEKDIAKIRNAVTVSGIEGVAVDTATVKRLGDRQIRVKLNFDGTDFVRDSALTFSVADGAITTYKGPALTAEVLVTASRGEDLLTIFWTDYDTEKIQRANLDGSSVEDLVTQGLSSPGGIALDVVGGKMYWTDWRTKKIQCANLDGSDVQALVTQGLRWPRGIALDVEGGKMYWTDSGTEKIQRANLDGSNIEDLVTQGLSGPFGIALDVVGGKMYWTDWSTEKIQRANLDGSNIEDLVTQGLSGPFGIALDVVGGKMYWTDSGTTDKIQRANLDGSNIEDLVKLRYGRQVGWEGPKCIALDVSGGKMYWTDSRTDKIRRASLDGSNIEDLVTQGLRSPYGIALGVLPSVGAPPDTPAPVTRKEDVNGDGVVDVQDLAYVGLQYGKTGANTADVNGDEVVDVDDFILVAAAVDTAAAAAPAARAQVHSHFTAAQLQGWLTEARASGNTSRTYQKGIAVLEQFLALVAPEETALLANYPNPFNPETWIPYQLSKSADVSLTIYDIQGRVVRALDLGHQRAGTYHSRSRAAYWDGRNSVGEPVASGVYFYTLSTESTRDSVTAGDFSATRKMLIRK